MVNILTSKDSFKFRIVELILLAMLKNEDKYGYQISQEVSDLSNGYLCLKEGSMYPVLYKLMEKGYIKSRTEKIGKCDQIPAGGNLLCITGRGCRSVCTGGRAGTERKDSGNRGSNEADE